MNIDKLLFFDIETCGKYATFNDYKKADIRGAELFEYKHQKKIKKDSWNPDVNIAYRENSPLLTEHGRIVCICMAFYKPDGSIKRGTIKNEDEYQLLVEAQQIFNKLSELGFTLCGFNIKGFDIPWLFKKFCSYGLVVPSCLNNVGKKPWEVNILDIADVWKGLSFEMNTFDEVAYSLNVQSPKSEMNGSMVHDYFWNEKRIDDIAKYCENDVTALIDICNILNKVI